MIYGIEIRDGHGGLLSVSLADILARLSPYGKDLHWAILSLEAVGDLGHDKSLPDFERQIAKSPRGLWVSWIELVELASKLEQVIDILVIGSSRKQNLRRYLCDDELRSSCDFVVDAFDSSYWSVHCPFFDVIQSLEERFTETTRI